MDYREFKGKTLNDAIEAACSYFNANERYIQYEVVKKSKNKNRLPFMANEIVIKAKPRKEKEESNRREESKSNLSDDSKYIVEILDNILKKTGYEYRLNNEETGSELRIGIFGPDMKGLIQEDGVGIESLKHIAGRIYSKSKNFNKRLHIDINDFRKEKEGYIKKLAHRLSEKAKRSKKEVVVNPMNAYDRRIFHLEVEEIDGVKTQSIGEGQFKKIRLIPS